MTTLTAPLATHEAPDRGELTLEVHLAGAWQELHGQGAAACPVCGDRMVLVGDSGHCDGCDARLD